MNASEIINKAKTQNIKLWVEGGRLKFRAPKGALSHDTKELLSNNRDKIIRALEKKTKEQSDIFPLSYNQQSLWFLHQLTSNYPSYNVAAACQIISELNIDAFLAAIEKMIDRHQVLRTTYHLSGQDNAPVQKIHKKVNTPFEHIDASGWPEHEIKNRVESYYKKPFDLEKGPVFRAHLFSINKTQHIFLMTVHHIACDAWSFNIILNDFTKFYEAEVNGLNVDSPPAAMEYFDHVKTQREMLNSHHGERLLSFWKTKLKNIPKRINLPADCERPLIQTYAGSSEFFNIEGSFYQHTRAFAKKTGITMYTLLLSVYQLLLIRLSGQNDVLVGTPAACRNKREYRNTCGYFINMLVVRGTYDDSMTFREYLAKTGKTVLDMLDFQDYPFPLLLEHLGIKRDPGVSPIFQVMFNMLHKKTLGVAADFLCPTATAEPVKFGAFNILPFPIPQQEGQYDQTLEIIDTEQSLFCVVKYNTDLFKQETAQKLISDYQLLLQDLLRNPDKPLSQLLNKINTIEKKSDASDESFEKCDIFQSSPDEPEVTIAVSSTFTIQLTEEMLAFWMAKLKIKSDIVFSPYNQVFQQLLDPTSLFSNNKNGINIIFVRFDDWLKTDNLGTDGSIDISQKELQSIRKNADEFLNAIDSAAKRTPASFIVSFCPSSTKLLQNTDYRHMIQQVEAELCNKLNKISAVYPIPSQEVLSLYPVERYYEPMGEEVGHIPYIQEFFVSISTIVSRKLFNILSKPFKAIILDCDNTLWSGVVGEDGALGVKIDDDKKWFQEFIVEQYNNGMLICLCSKNIESDVFDVFDNHPDMILKQSQLAASRINWSPKSQNLHYMARELNIGLDSFILIDDSPVECAEVQAGCPEILTIQLPTEDLDISHFFRHIWAFDHLKITQEDKKRSDLYRTSQNREQFLKESSDFSAFIDGLNLDIRIAEMEAGQIPRVSQLTQRVNQFNLTTIRRTEGEIEKLCKAENVHCYTVSMSDRFGDYGLVGVIIAEQLVDVLNVDSLLLSCRSLGRGVEHRMISFLGEVAEREALEHIQLRYSATKKNIPLRDFLASIAETHGKKTGDGVVYKIPRTVAAKITFAPKTSRLIEEKNTKNITKKKTSERSTKNQGIDTADLMIEIANDLSRVAHIQQAIQPKKTKDAKAGLYDTVPSLETIAKIASVWSNILPVDHINPRDNFFDIGGKSILIPLIVIQLKKKFDIAISIVNMLQYPTIASLANYVDNKTTASMEKVQVQSGRQIAALKKQQQRVQIARRQMPQI